MRRTSHQVIQQGVQKKNSLPRQWNLLPQGMVLNYIKMKQAHDSTQLATDLDEERWEEAHMEYKHQCGLAGLKITR